MGFTDRGHIKNTPDLGNRRCFDAILRRKSYFRDSSTATATETVIPTMGLLPAPRKTSTVPFGGTSLWHPVSVNVHIRQGKYLHVPLLTR